MEAIAFNKTLFLSEESGQGLTEYALIIALIAIAAVAAVTVFGNGLSNFIFTRIAEELGAI